ncbi:hypothetical protein C6495_03575 [Candidatus Poribacteria bacterium]|nr:MAG: hypothetical protein C6495_03575 [Candidatus Poribacteria bacterium]
MKKVLVWTTLMLVFAAGVAFATQSPSVQGEYIEARSASVYTGACHFGAEFVDGGKEATLVWNIQHGTWNDVSLDGLTVVAIVTAKKNLAIDTETRKSVLYVDTDTTAAQRIALRNMLATKQAEVLGDIVAMQSAPLSFAKEGTRFDVTVGEVLALSANRYPCAACTQPHQIWYQPLAPVQNAIVGKSEVYRYQDTHLAVTWHQGGAVNNVFVGDFSM